MKILALELSEKTGLAASTVRQWLSTQEKYRVNEIEKPLIYDIPDEVMQEFYNSLLYTKKKISKEVKDKVRLLIKE